MLALPRHELETFTGNMLGDGSIRYPNFSRDKLTSGNARYGMTMGIAGYAYMDHLYTTVYAKYSSSGLLAYPKDNATQYHFDTRSLPIFTALHDL